MNQEKSAVDRPWKRKFLGFSFTSHLKPKVRIAPQSLQRVKQKIRQITSRTKVKRLIVLGVPKGKAYEWGNSRKGYWRISKSPVLHRTLDNRFFESYQIKSLAKRYDSLRRPNGTYGGVRGRGFIAPSYSILAMLLMLNFVVLRVFLVCRFLLDSWYCAVILLCICSTLLVIRRRQVVRILLIAGLLLIVCIWRWSRC